MAEKEAIMEFSWWAWWVTMAFWLVQAGLSFKEKTFSLKQLLEGGVAVSCPDRYNKWKHLPMSFLNNWTVSIADPLVWPIVNGLVVPQIWLMAGWRWEHLVFFFIGIMTSIIAHRIWWGHDENLGHVFKKWGVLERDFFMADLTRAGQAHFWFMAAQVALVLAYIFTPMPRAAVLWMNGLLVVFFAIQNIQAAVIQQGDERKGYTVAAMEIFAIGVITLIKI